MKLTSFHSSVSSSMGQRCSIAKVDRTSFENEEAHGSKGVTPVCNSAQQEKWGGSFLLGNLELVECKNGNSRDLGFLGRREVMGRVVWSGPSG